MRFSFHLSSVLNGSQRSLPFHLPTMIGISYKTIFSIHQLISAPFSFKGVINASTWSHTVKVPEHWSNFSGLCSGCQSLYTSCFSSPGPEGLSTELSPAEKPAPGGNSCTCWWVHEAVPKLFPRFVLGDGGDNKKWSRESLRLLCSDRFVDRCLGAVG